MTTAHSLAKSETIWPHYSPGQYGELALVTHDSYSAQSSSLCVSSFLLLCVAVMCFCVRACNMCVCV